MNHTKLEEINNLVTKATRELHTEKHKDPTLNGAHSLASALYHHLYEFNRPLRERSLRDEERDVFMRIGEALRDLIAYYGVSVEEADMLMMWPPK